MIRAVCGLREEMLALERRQNGAGMFGSKPEHPRNLRRVDNEAGHLEKLVTNPQRVLIDRITGNDHRHTSHAQVYRQSQKPDGYPQRL